MVGEGEGRGGERTLSVRSLGVCREGSSEAGDVVVVCVVVAVAGRGCTSRE